MAEDEVVVRKAAPEDAAQFAHLMRGHFSWTLPALTDAQHVVAAAKLFDKARSMKGVNLVAKTSSGRVVGYVTGQPYSRSIDDYGYIHSDVGVITQLVVDQEWRGRGIGADLLNRAHRVMAGLGFSIVIAHIPESLKPWYKQLGWTDLPSGTGLAWIETHRTGSSDGLPEDAPQELKKEHTAAYSQDPLGEYGYNTIAFKKTAASSGIITAAFYEVHADAARRDQAISEALHLATEMTDGARERIPFGSQLLLFLASLPYDEQVKFAAELEKRTNN